MMLAVPKSDILQAIMVTYENRKELMDFLGEHMHRMSITSDGDISLEIVNDCDNFSGFLSGSYDYQEASTGDIIMKFSVGYFMVMKAPMFKLLFDYHFVPDKPPEEWENSNDREVSKKTGQS